MRAHRKTSLGLAAAGLLAVAAAAGPASAVSTLTQLDPTGTGNFAGPTAVKGINSWDWQDTGSLVIESALVSSSNGAATLDSFFAAAANGDTLEFTIHAQARLNGLSGGTPNPPPGLSTDGTGPGYEITATLDAVEKATFVKFGTTASLFFTGITSGTFQYYLDTTPDSNVATGTGFNSGTVGGNPFLFGTITGVGGSFSVDTVNPGGTVSGGASNLTMRIDGYNNKIIEPDPMAPGLVLVGTTFQSNINLTDQIGTTDFLGKNLLPGAALDVGDSPYSFLRGVVVGGTLRGTNGDVILRADASSTFDAAVVPEPGTMILLGSGLLGVAGVARRKKKA